MKLLIIGGSGFFGKSFLDAFISKYLDFWNIEKIIIISRNSKFYYDKDLYKFNIEFIESDISFIKKIPEADYIFNFANSNDISFYLDRTNQPIYQAKSGIDNFVNLMKNYNKDAKIIFSSSGAVYGPESNKCRFFRETDDSKNINLFPKNKEIYAISKKYSEERLIELSRFGFKVAILRCFAFHGRWLPLNKHFVLGNFFYDLFFSSEINVKSTINVYRSFMHVNDLIDWFMTILTNINQNLIIANIGSDEPVEIRDLAKMVASLNNKTVKQNEISSNAIDSYLPDTNYIKNKFNLKLKINLIDSLNILYHDLKKNDFVYKLYK